MTKKNAKQAGKATAMKTAMPSAEVQMLEQAAEQQAQAPLSEKASDRMRASAIQRNQGRVGDMEVKRGQYCATCDKWHGPKDAKPGCSPVALG